MRLASEQTTSFALGANDSAAQDGYRPEESQRIVNFRPTLQGRSIKVRGGTWSPMGIAIPTTTYAPVGAKRWVLTDGTQQIVMLDTNNDLWYSNDEGLTWTDGGNIGGATKAKRWSFAVIREGAANVLCLAGGHTSSYQWTGSSLSAISNIPSGVSLLAVHGNRLIASGHSGIDVAASKVGDIDVWAEPDGWTVKAATHDGDTEITGLFTLGSVIMVFKRESVGYIEGFGFNTLQVETGARGLSRSVGCIAHRSIAPLGDSGVMWLSERGFESYYLGGQVTLASERMQAFVDSILMDEITSNGYGIPSAIWLPREREYWCAVPVGAFYIGELGNANGYLGNTYIFCYRPPTQTTPDAMWCFKFADNPSSTTTNSDQTPYSLSVDSDGFLGLNTDTTGQEVTVGNGGALQLVARNEYGLNVHIENNGALSLGVAGFTKTGEFNGDLLPSSLIVLDRGGELSRPAMFSLMNWFYYLDDASVGDDGRRADTVISDVRDIEAVSRLRPLLFGAQFNRKKAKRVRVQSSQIKASTVNVRVYADGVAGATQALTIAGSSRGRALESTARVGGRGRVLEVELTTADQVDIVACDVLAQVLSDRP